MSHGHTYGWFLLIYSRNQHNIVKQLSFKINKFKKRKKCPIWKKIIRNNNASNNQHWLLGRLEVASLSQILWLESSVFGIGLSFADALLALRCHGLFAGLWRPQQGRSLWHLPLHWFWHRLLHYLMCPI